MTRRSIVARLAGSIVALCAVPALARSRDSESLSRSEESTGLAWPVSPPDGQREKPRFRHMCFDRACVFIGRIIDHHVGDEYDLWYCHSTGQVIVHFSDTDTEAERLNAITADSAPALREGAARVRRWMQSQARIGAELPPKFHAAVMDAMPKEEHRRLVFRAVAERAKDGIVMDPRTVSWLDRDAAEEARAVLVRLGRLER